MSTTGKKVAVADRMGDREYLETYAGLADNVSSILHDRESTGKTQEELDAIIRANVHAVYEIFGRDLDLIEDLIEKGEWTA